MKLGFGSYLLSYVDADIKNTHSLVSDADIEDIQILFNKQKFDLTLYNGTDLEIEVSVLRIPICHRISPVNALNPFLDLPSGLRDKFETIRRAFVDYLCEGKEGSQEEILARMCESAGASDKAIVRRV